MTLPIAYTPCPQCGAKVYVLYREHDDLVVCQVCLCAWWVQLDEAAITLREMEE